MYSESHAYRLEVFQVGGDNFPGSKEGRIFLQQGDQQSIIKPGAIMEEEGDFLTPRLELKVADLVCCPSNLTTDTQVRELVYVCARAQEASYLM